MHEQGLLGEEWKDRVSSETTYWLDHIYCRAWWENFKAQSVDNELPRELQKLIDQLLDESNNFHVVYHEGIMDRVKATLEDQTIGRE